MCQWAIDMRCLLPSYSVSFRRGTILLEAEQPSCKVLLIEAPRWALQSRRNAGVVAEG